MAFGFDDAAMLAMVALGLLGGKKKNEQTQTTVSPPWQPRDPGYNVLSPYLLSMLTQNLGRLSGAGYPGGVGIGGDMTSQLIDMVNQSWPDIMKNAATPKQDWTGWSKVSLSECYKKCQAKGIKYGSPELESCMKSCMASGIETNKANA
jgi:hypothetical protein